MGSVYLDLESIPRQPEESSKLIVAQGIKHPAAMKKQETIEAWHNGEGKYAGEKDAAIEKEYRKGALDGGVGEVISVAFSIDGEMISYYRELDDEDYTEKLMLTNVFSRILNMKLSVTDPYFIGHNIKFDLKFLWRRAKVLGLDVGFKLPFRGRHRTDFFCNAAEWCDYNEYISQDKLAKILGLPGKPDDINGANVWDHVKRGEEARVAEYNVSDVETVIQIHERLK